MIVDDAVVVRRLVSDVLSAVPTIEVVGTAPNGRLALAKIPQLRPELVVLDVEMPEMDGIETLTALREAHPDLPVIMFSTLTARGAAVTLEALMRGANDYVTKPANVGSVSEAMEQVRSELVPRIHSLCGVSEGAAPSRHTPRRDARPTGAPRDVDRPAPAGSRPNRGPAARVDLVVIGISTGGPSALADALPRLPADLPVPVVVVQHMPPMFTQLLAERLDRAASLRVQEAQGGERLTAGTCWIAPGDRHLSVELAPDGGGLVTRVHDGPKENSCRPSVDVLFRSVAGIVGPHSLGVMMTGMGQDGLAGSEAIVAAGGRIIAQDERSSVVWGMPGAVTHAGLPDAVVDLAGLPGEIVRRVALHRVPPLAGAAR